MLLVGPPGTGKTLLARAVAGEAGVPFFSISGSEFVEMFVGVGASRVRDLFDQAKRNSPCIVFVDEIDAVGRQRGAGLGGSHDEREQTLNQILVEMDGFDTNTNVIVVAATNRPDVLDPALLRPGRFDRQVILDRPGHEGPPRDPQGPHQGQAARQERRPAASSPASRPASPAPTWPTSSTRRRSSPRGATRRSSARRSSSEALERVIAGPERKSRVISDAEKAIIAYHEGGHAVVQRILPKADPVAKVSIISRGMALGYTMGLPTEDRYLQSKTEFEDKIAAMLGGNASEKLIFGDTTTGASNDIEKATNLARRMVTEFGMSERLGPLAFGKRDELVFLGREIGEQRNYSDEVAKQIDEEVRAIIDRGYSRAMDVLTQHKDRLVQLAERLVAEETIEQDEFEAMFADLPDPRADTHITPVPLDGPIVRRAPAEPAAGPAPAPRLRPAGLTTASPPQRRQRRESAEMATSGLPSRMPARTDERRLGQRFDDLDAFFERTADERLADYLDLLRIPSIGTLSENDADTQRGGPVRRRSLRGDGLRARRVSPNRRPSNGLCRLAARRGRADGHRLRPLRRPARRSARPVAAAAIRPGRRGRPRLRPWRGRRQGPRPPAPVGRHGRGSRRAASCRSTSGSSWRARRSPAPTISMPWLTANRDRLKRRPRR